MTHKILIVDDDEDTRILLAEDMRELGYEVVMASDGTQAVALARHERPSLIILDYRLPGGDGGTVLERLKCIAATAVIPVVVFSRQHADQVREEVLQLGAHSYVQKSFATMELRQAIGSILGDAQPRPDEYALRPA